MGSYFGLPLLRIVIFNMKKGMALVFYYEHMVYIWLCLFLVSQSMIVTKSLCHFSLSSRQSPRLTQLRLLQSEEDSIALFDANRGCCVCVGTFSQVSTATFTK